MDSLRLLAAALIVALATSTLPAAAGAAECIDEDLADRLAVKRKRRGRDPRDFVKAQRHEITFNGGYYVSDLFSGTYILGGAYTYHMTEDAAVEASFGWTHANAEVIRAIEDGRGQVVDDVYATTTFAASSLLWYPLHGKFRFGGSIVHFDIHLDLGVGVVDSSTSRGAAGLAGFGFKFYTGKAVALRIDAKDYVYRQELLDERFLVNDVSVTAGLSLFLPLGF